MLKYGRAGALTAQHVKLGVDRVKLKNSYSKPYSQLGVRFVINDNTCSLFPLSPRRVRGENTIQGCKPPGCTLS